MLLELEADTSFHTATCNLRPRESSIAGQAKYVGGHIRKNQQVLVSPGVRMVAR